jgi:hypothetical protein
MAVLFDFTETAAQTLRYALDLSLHYSSGLHLRVVRAPHAAQEAPAQEFERLDGALPLKKALHRRLQEHYPEACDRLTSLTITDHRPLKADHLMGSALLADTDLLLAPLLSHQSYDMLGDGCRYAQQEATQSDVPVLLVPRGARCQGPLCLALTEEAEKTERPCEGFLKLAERLQATAVQIRFQYSAWEAQQLSPRKDAASQTGPYFHPGFLPREPSEEDAAPGREHHCLLSSRSSTYYMTNEASPWGGLAGMLESWYQKTVAFVPGSQETFKELLHSAASSATQRAIAVMPLLAQKRSQLAMALCN